MRTAIYPGSFDPITNGHFDIIRRASRMFDTLIVGVLKNSAKSSLFTAKERVKMIQELTQDLPNIEVQAFNGMLIDFARANGASVIVRGLRAVTDFEYELQLSQTNKVMAPEVDTIFLTTNLQYSYLSSSIVKEIASYKGDISAFVDDRVAALIMEKIEMKESCDE